jgi:hypothetical protein
VSEHPRDGRSYIPEAAWRAFSETEPEWKFTDKYDRHAQLEAAAPHIARAERERIERAVRDLPWKLAKDGTGWVQLEHVLKAVLSE